MQVKSFGTTLKMVGQESKSHVRNCVWSFGWGSHGCLGHGKYFDILEPKQLQSFTELDIISVDSGWAHNLALTSDGNVYRWGWADDIKTIYSVANLKINAPQLLRGMQNAGQHLRLGWIMHDSAQLWPTHMSSLAEISVRKIVCGAATSFVLSTDGRVFSWGTGRWGQLGHKIYNHYTEECANPTVVERLLSQNIVDVAVGYVHTLFLDDTGCVWVCGPGLNGRLGLGLGARIGEYPIPRPMTPLWEQHFRHSAQKAIAVVSQSTNNELMHSASTQMTLSNNMQLRMDEEFYSPKIIKISAGHKHSALLTEDGKVWTFGSGNCGALGHAMDFSDKHWPTLVLPLQNKRIVDIDCGQHHMLALSDDGQVYSWGMSRNGQCGRPRTDAFMLEDVRERGTDLSKSCIEHRPPYPLSNVDTQYIDADDGVLLKGDPLAMAVGVISLPSGMKPKSIEAGFYESSIITQCGRVVCYGADGERLENNPFAKIIQMPSKRSAIVQIKHGWKHSLIMTQESD